MSWDWSSWTIHWKLQVDVRLLFSEQSLHDVAHSIASVKLWRQRRQWDLRLGGVSRFVRRRRRDKFSPANGGRIWWLMSVLGTLFVSRTVKYDRLSCFHANLCFLFLITSSSACIHKRFLSSEHLASVKISIQRPSDSRAVYGRIYCD